MMKKTLLDDKRFQYILNTVLIVALYLVIMALINNKVLNRYQANMLIPIGFNIIMAVSLNLTAGYLGQLPLGHAGFMAVGAYTSALFTLAVDLPAYAEFPVALLLGGIMAGIFGIIIGLPALRLRGDYLAIITLGFGEIIRVLLLNLEFTGGAFGLGGIQKHTTVTWTYVCVVITLFVIHALMKSRHGRAILSIRENEIAAEACGIKTTYYKTMAFAISAFFAGVAGGLYAHYLRILDPSTFAFTKSIDYLVMVVLGGMGSMIGSVVAAIGLTWLPELLRAVEQYRMVLYAALLVIVMVLKPSGLMGTYDFSLSRVLKAIGRRFSGRRKKKGDGAI